jgi:hypothetical protein
MADGTFDKLIVNNSLGIGIDPPNAQLHIDANAAEGKILIESGSNLFKLAVDGTGATLGTANGFLALQTDDSSRLTITQPGDVGIGKNPSFKLDVNGVVNAIGFNKGGVPWQLETGDIANNAITAAKIADLTVGTSELAAAAVTEAKLANNAITTTKLADSAVTSTKLADGAVVSSKITDNAIIGTKIADGSVTTSKIADDSVTTNKIPDGSIPATKLAPGTIPGGSQWVNGADSSIAYAGGNVGIGRPAAAFAKLAVNGAIGFSNDTSPMLYMFESGTSNPQRAVIAHSPSASGWGMFYRDDDDTMLFQSQNGFTQTTTVQPVGTVKAGIGGIGGVGRIPDVVVKLPDDRFKFPFSFTRTVMAIGLGNGNVGINTDKPTTTLDVVGITRTQRLRLGDKWQLSGVGDAHGNDEWLRIFNTAGNDYFGGIAAGKLWTSSGTLAGSDLRLKTEITNLTQSLPKLAQLRGVSFFWKDKNRGAGQQLGLIAQEVEAVFPALVETGPDGMKAVNYTGLIPALIEAIKEQQRLITQLQTDVQRLQPLARL